ncbi:hypothetical protein OG884_18265 [Streptosporangium sp. NBC_01755]|uniref:hypothetical protein n=1 Tax=Streptosporangium sp. NBC_01755 TaxID=2975949 RepID=UPI002DD9D780|nr:hypothetical protein [Streptosporangium sp. NBC_01755]WSD03751.1 hypothetical protein OG884_18265 [Streptosporangium sp. NBC_01755]
MTPKRATRIAITLGVVGGIYTVGAPHVLPPENFDLAFCGAAVVTVAGATGIGIIAALQRITERLDRLNQSVNNNTTKIITRLDEHANRTNTHVDKATDRLGTQLTNEREIHIARTGMLRGMVLALSGGDDPHNTNSHPWA